MKAVFTCDGSCRGNPGFGGYGIFGYLYKDSPRPKNTKHPLKDKFYFTHKGLTATKSDIPIEVTHILEFVRATNNPRTTNNENELKAVLHVMELMVARPDVTDVHIISDSEYVVQGVNEHMTKWGASGWRRANGATIAYVDMWTSILLCVKAFEDRGTNLTVEWVKGHSEDYGNDLADLYSVIGSNAARYQFENPNGEFKTDIYTSEVTYADYKKSYHKDFLYHFKDLFFSSDPNTKDENYCFVTANEDEEEIGKRDNTTIFLANHGAVPPFIHNLRQFYRTIPRLYVTMCSLKLSKMENRDVVRLGAVIPAQYLLVPTGRNNRNIYALVDSATVSPVAFMQENTIHFPFIGSVSKMHELLSCPDLSTLPKVQVWDVTDRFIKDKKLTLTNKDKFVDFTDLTEGRLVLTQRLMASVGADIPNYLALKRIEDEIEQVHAIMYGSTNNNLYTLFIRITTPSRVFYSVNVVNKYLAVATVNS